MRITAKPMKVTVTFKLPEDKWDYNCFKASAEMSSVILDLDSLLRSVSKHGHNITSVTEFAHFIRSEYISEVVSDLHKES